MKRFFYLGCGASMLFELVNVYFIMPFPGSQELSYLGLAYFLVSYRWVFRALCLVGIVFGAKKAFLAKKWLFYTVLLLNFICFYSANFVMAADAMFSPPKQLLLEEAKSNKIPLDRLVIGVVIGGEAKAYPIYLIGYHHQVRDQVGGKEIMVTYCTVCRTGRVYEPQLQGELQEFRLVGMNQYNALFEDKKTKSWWRQANGEAIIGPLKGVLLPEVASQQSTLAMWLSMYPNSKIMQEDPNFLDRYDNRGKFEKGTSTSALTGTDSSSWNRKSWVVGLEIGTESLAVDWNRLEEERVIHLQLGETPLLLVLANDSTSFFAFERPSPEARFRLEGNFLLSDSAKYTLQGQSLTNQAALKRIVAHQEFWHSWQSFHPNTAKH
ncbi:MAG: hypothetical protein RL407_1335 [Bacteroidota bacterium]|jgi:hypothetical protein